MFQIGEFSRIAVVTIDTLRHYDTIGLLKPAKVDSNTGYRYYSAGQLQRLNKILALKEVGLSLEEIARILEDNLTVDEVRGMLKAQLAMTESALEQAQRRQQNILARLKSLEAENKTPEYEVNLKSVDELMLVSIRETIPTIEQIPQRWNETFTSIASWMKESSVPIGIPIAFYHDNGYTQENIDTECAFTIPNMEASKIKKPSEPMIVRPLDAMPLVATIVVANFHMIEEGLKSAYKALGDWVANNNYHIIDSPRELYYGSPQSGDFAAEIQFPICHADYKN